MPHVLSLILLIIGITLILDPWWSNKVQTVMGRHACVCDVMHMLGPCMWRHHTLWPHVKAQQQNSSSRKEKYYNIQTSFFCWVSHQGIKAKPDSCKICLSIFSEWVLVEWFPETVVCFHMLDFIKVILYGKSDIAWFGEYHVYFVSCDWLLTNRIRDSTWGIE